jgi:glycolate oxidase FAD binding subunit
LAVGSYNEFRRPHPAAVGDLAVILAPSPTDVLAPLARHQPASAAEVGELVRRAAADGQAVYPVGGGTSLHLGLPPARPGFVLATERLDGVVDYPARDMTITVQAGLTVGRLQTLLATENQRLPIDVPHVARATVGGIVAANVSGPRRLGWGTLRDYVIGITVVNDEGHETRAGGRVVKNVAGYDLCKLHVGGLGTLGVITQVTFKLRPRPEEQAVVAFACPPSDLDGALNQIHATRTRPVAVELLNPAAVQALTGSLPGTRPDGWAVAVGFEDNADAVKWQLKQLVLELGGRFNISGAVGECAGPLWQTLVAATACPEEGWSFKAGVLSSQTAAFCLHAAQLAPEAGLQAHAASGIVLGHVAEEGRRDQAAAVVQGLRERAASCGGYVVVTRCPPAWKDAAFVWGPPRGDWALMAAVKQKLDPRRLFNPGRLVGGL